MNTPATATPPLETQAVTITAPPAWRSRLIQILQIVGVLIGLLGTADMMNMIQALNPQFAAWLAVSGTALRFGIEPLILLIGDLTDDGKLNKSFKLTLILLPFLLLTCLLLPSCGTAISLTTPWGEATSDSAGNITIAPKATRWVIPTK